MFPLPLPIPPGAISTGVVSLGPVVMSSPMVIASVFKPYQTTIQVLNQWFNYSPDLVILFLITVLIIVRLLIMMSKNSKSFLRTLFDVVSMIFYQSFPDHGTIQSTIMVTIVAIGIFFWMQIWCNMVSTDMIVSDDRYVIRGVDDLIRLGTKCIMAENDPAFDIIKVRF